MSADHLTPPSDPPAALASATTHAPGMRIESAVLDVLSGSTLATAATAHGLDVEDLAEAVELYRNAGRAALDQRDQQQWYHVRLQFPDWPQAEQPAHQHLLPALTRLQDRGAFTGCWFLRKYPYWRLRFHHPDPPRIDHELDQLTQHGQIGAWNRGIYEPETTAFGGPTATRIVHHLFCLDSHELLHALPAIKDTRRETSLVLLTALFDAAGLDLFERGDVYALLQVLRPLPAVPDPNHSARQLRALAETIRTVLTAHPAHTRSSATGRFEHLVPSRSWLTAYATAGNTLGQAAAAGHLDRGLRHVLAQIVIFSWNRLGLGATTQAVLAAAATTATLEGTRTAWTPTP